MKRTNTVSVDEVAPEKLDEVYDLYKARLSENGCGCWIMATYHKKAHNHFSYLTPQQVDGKAIPYFRVRTVDVIRKKHGLSTGSRRSYVMSCGNAWCFNPAHQMEHKGGNKRKEITAESVEKCGALHKHGWSMFYQVSETDQQSYLQVIKDERFSQVVPVSLPMVVDIRVVAKIFELFEVGKRLPTIAEMMEHTGLSFEALLPYGYAVNALEYRTKRKESYELCRVMLQEFLKGTPTTEIARLIGVNAARVNGFRGSLFG